MTLTATEKAVLDGIKQAFSAINALNLTCTQIIDYVPATVSYGEFSEALRGLERMRLVQREVISKIGRYYLTAKGKEVA